MLLLATDITAFHIIGIALALWALILTGLGVRRHDFPGKDSGQTVVMAITTLLVVGAIGTAIATAKNEPKGGAEASNNAVETTPQQAPAPTPPPTGPVTALSLKADGSGMLRFDKTSLQAPAGNVKITMTNPSPLEHNIAIEGPGLSPMEGPKVSTNGTSTVEAKLKAGSYTFYCSVDGHRAAGMQGTLTVK